MMLALEQREYADLQCLNVFHNETRLRGPVLMLAAWLAHAVQTYSARFVAKTDDDSYVHLPRLLQLLRAVDRRPLVFLGKASLPEPTCTPDQIGRLISDARGAPTACMVPLAPQNI